MSKSKFSLSTPPAYKLSPENAHTAVMQLVDHYEVNIDAKGDDDRLKIEKTLTELAEFYRLGYLENKATPDGLQVIQHLQHAPGKKADSKTSVEVADSVVYSELTGKARRQIKVKASGEMGVYDLQYSVMASLSDTSVEYISSFRSPDFAAMEALADFFISL
jgi:antitoxin component HigA of HigAB toxin-antitoxin module